MLLITVTIEIAGTYGADANSVVFTMSVNGQTQGSDGKLTLTTDESLFTFWTCGGVSLPLSFSHNIYRLHSGLPVRLLLPRGHDGGVFSACYWWTKLAQLILMLVKWATFGVLCHIRI